jgi:hypothetical protein
MDEKSVKKSKSRKEQRHDQRVKEDEIRRGEQKSQPSGMRKDRKVSRELNAELKHSNVLDDRAKRLSELKYLMEIADDDEEIKQLKSEIRELIRKPLDHKVVVEDSDYDLEIISNVLASALLSSAPPATATTKKESPTVTEVWGDEAASECEVDIENVFQEDNVSDRQSQYGYDMEENPLDPDSDSENSCFSETIPLPPTRISPRRALPPPRVPPPHVFAQPVTASDAHDDSDNPLEDLYALSKKKKPVQKKRKR